MKIKKFNESLDEGNPEIGDFVICEDEANYLFKDNIGKIVDYVSIFNAAYPYIVKYDFDEKLLNDLKAFTAKGIDDAFPFSRKEIIHFSKNKNDLILILKANKFNL